MDSKAALNFASKVKEDELARGHSGGLGRTAGGLVRWASRNAVQQGMPDTALYRNFTLSKIDAEIIAKTQPKKKAEESDDDSVMRVKMDADGPAQKMKIGVLRDGVEKARSHTASNASSNRSSSVSSDSSDSSDSEDDSAPPPQQLVGGVAVRDVTLALMDIQGKKTTMREALSIALRGLPKEQFSSTAYNRLLVSSVQGNIKKGSAIDAGNNEKVKLADLAITGCSGFLDINLSENAANSGEDFGVSEGSQLFMELSTATDDDEEGDLQFAGAVSLEDVYLQPGSELICRAVLVRVGGEDGTPNEAKRSKPAPVNQEFADQVTSHKGETKMGKAEVGTACQVLLEWDVETPTPVTALIKQVLKDKNVLPKDIRKNATRLFISRIEAATLAKGKGSELGDLQTASEAGGLKGSTVIDGAGMIRVDLLSEDGLTDEADQNMYIEASVHNKPGQHIYAGRVLAAQTTFTGRVSLRGLLLSKKK